MLHIALNNSKDKKSAIVRKEDARSREEIVWLNLRKFIKEGGFLILHNCMNLVFKELTLLVPDLNDSIDLGCENGLFGPEQITHKEEEIGEKVNFTTKRTHKMYF